MVGPRVSLIHVSDRWLYNADCDDSFGASLSYASSDGQSGAVSPQTLSNAMIQDDTEVVILSNRSCDDGGCGYTRPGGVAYRKYSPPNFELAVNQF